MSRQSRKSARRAAENGITNGQKKKQPRPGGHGNHVNEYAQHSKAPTNEADSAREVARRLGSSSFAALVGVDISPPRNPWDRY